MITHEMAVIEAICDSVAIIDHSHIAEVGSVSDIFSEPQVGDRPAADAEATRLSRTVSFGKSSQIRIYFDGRESF
ncbi:MAG: hypothetical protein ACLSAC_09605 [Enterocloster bolteae]